MNTWLLPTSVEVNGESFNIRSDFRAILDILDALDNQELNSVEKAIVTIEIFYEDYEKIPLESMQEACDKAMEFINFMGEESTKPVKLMDWQQDANILIPAINKVLGKEIRSVPYMHWWTFMGAYMEIGESLFSQVLAIRQKKASRKKLDKWESEFYKKNRSIIDLNYKKQERSADEKEELRKLLGLEKR